MVVAFDNHQNNIVFDIEYYFCLKHFQYIFHPLKQNNEDNYFHFLYY